MISSEYNFFHSQYVASEAQSKEPETPDAHLSGEFSSAQPVVSDDLLKRTAEPRFTNNYMRSSGFSSVFLNAHSQEYLHLVKAISVMEKGPGFNDDKLGSISRKKMTVSQLKKMKSDLKNEKERNLSELECLSERLSVDVANEEQEICQQDIARMLVILSDFYSSCHFIKCMFFILQKVLRDHGRAESAVISDAIRLECGEIVELIFRIVISSDDLKVTSGFYKWYSAWDMYYVFNIIGCCFNTDGSNYCAPYFSPELPVKLALKTFGRLRDITEREKEFLKMKRDVGNNDTLMVQPLHFRLLEGKDVNLEVVITHVKNGCHAFQSKDLSDKKNLLEYIGLLQFLHTATVCVLEKFDQDARRLLECYDYFSGLQPSAGILKQYMEARCKEASGAVDAASLIYQSLANGEYKVPVFEEWIACLEKLSDNDAVAKTCLEAADYYRNNGITWREEYYEHKSASNMLLMANRESIQESDQLTAQDGIDVNSFQSDFELKAKACRRKKNKGKRNDKAKDRIKNHTTTSQYTETLTLAQPYPVVQPCSARNVKKDTTHVTHSEAVVTSVPKPVNGKS